MRNTTKSNTTKKAMLQALEKSLGIVSIACEKVGIERSTHYRWMESDVEYKQSVEAIAEIALDFAESKLFKSIENGSDTATIFYLKTKGKKRGYIERQEVAHSMDAVVMDIVNGKVSIGQLSDEQLEQLRAEIANK